MTDASQIPPLMVELITETEGTEENPVIFTGRAREIIAEISAFAETMKVYAKYREKAESAVPQDITPEELLLYILCLAGEGPTYYHTILPVIMHMPRLARLLEKKPE